MTKLVISTCAIAILLSSCGFFQGHRLEGKWKCGILQISIYEDGAASVSGLKAAWKKLDRRSIRVEFTEEEETVFAELTEDKGSASSSKTARLSVGPLLVNCSRVKE